VGDDASPVAPTYRTFDLGDDLSVQIIPIEALQEQDVNAQVMEPGDFDRLTENVKNRGALESLPFVTPNGGRFEIISGHHRVRAAKAAGLHEVPVLVEGRELRRSAIVAKQIAHNQLTGTQDAAVLRQLTTFIDTPDDFLETGLPDEFLPLPLDKDTTALSTPSPSMEWRTVTFAFLPHEFTNFTGLLDTLDEKVELLGANELGCYQAFAQAVARVSRVKDIRSTGTAIAALTDAARLIEDDEPGDDEWVVFPVGKMPAQAAKVIEMAVEHALAVGDASHRWQALEFMAAEWLAGPNGPSGDDLDG
jgi:hypothetical protein